MVSPSIAVGLFTTICKEAGAEVRLFETTAYDDEAASTHATKEKFGAGQQIRNYVDAFENVYPTNQMIPDLIETVEEYKPDLILMSCVEDTFRDGTMMLEAIEPFNIPHIMGGVFPINAPWQALDNPHVNVICRYEGEQVVRDALAGIPLNEIKGLWWKDGDKVVQNPPQELVNISDTYIDYSLYRSERFYRPIGGRIVKTVQLETYRGCPYSCTYCNSPTTRLMDRNFLRRKDLTVLRAEMERMVEELNPDYWFILDDSFTARPRKELFALLELLEEFGLPWWCNTRLDDIDDEILAAMKKAHCDRIQFGIESGNEEYRINVLKRRVKQDVYLEKADMLNRSGVPYGLNAIIGMPHESKDMVLETAKLCKAVGGYDGLGVSIFIPYWGTELREVAVSAGFMEYDNIGSDGGFQDKPILEMPPPYLSNAETFELASKFKYYTYFDEKFWPEIDAATDMAPWEEIYQREFYYSDKAEGGRDRIEQKKRSPYACAADPYVEF